MVIVLEFHINKSINVLRLYCDECSCVNVLEFNDVILKKYFYLCTRYDLAYKMLSNINLQKSNNVINTIKLEIGSISLELRNMGKKFMMMMLGIIDVNSLISSLNYDVINEFVHHFIHNIDDNWMKNNIVLLRRGTKRKIL